MSGPSGTWTTTSGGSGDNLVALVAVIAPCVVIFAVAAAVAKTVASIPVYVWILASVFMVTGVAAFARFTVRSNRQQAAACAARRAEMTAAEEAAALARHERRLALAAASSPIIHNHIWPSVEAAHAVMARGFTPTTILTHQQEIER